MAFICISRSVTKRILSFQQTMTITSRLCSTALPTTQTDAAAAAAAAAAVQPPPATSLIAGSQIIPATFSAGFFRFKHVQETYVLHYWTPVSQIPEVMTASVLSQDNTLARDPLSATQDMTSIPATVKVIDVTNSIIDPKTEPLAFGHAMSESCSILIEGTSEQQQVAICLQLDGPVDALKKWESTEIPPKQYEDQVLMKEKEALLTTYTPMSDQFSQLLLKAESQAMTRFKWGGLFLLSAQLGFVARLTWFEYSWDIMEPITWCITYSLMISTFAYYVMTSQEFMLPLAEKRAVQERFWKIVKKNNFDVHEFRRLRRQLLALEQRGSLSTTAAGGQTTFDRVFKAIQA